MLHSSDDLRFFQMKVVYEIFVPNLHTLHGSSSVPPTISYYLAARKLGWSQVKVKITESSTLCSTWDHLRCARGSCVQAYSDTTLIIQWWQLKFDFIARLRSTYSRWRQKAKRDPSQTCFLIVDSTGQFEFGLPQLTTVKNDIRGHALKVQPIGELKHSQSKHLLTLCPLTEKYETGYNHTTESIQGFFSSRKI